MFTGSTHTDLEHIEEFQSRFKYARPQMICLAENQGRYFVNNTDPTNVARLWLPEGKEYEEYLILSDHNRQSVPISIERLGSNRRMINGHMRTYHTADKMGIDLSWEDLPSRAYPVLGSYGNYSFTVDGGAGGLQMKDWYLKHRGSMYVFMSYDNIPISAVHGTVAFNGYGRVYEMVITEFSYEVNKRGKPHVLGSDIYAIDHWNVSMSLEEV